MQNSLDALQAQARYRQHDMEAEADRARLSRAARTRRSRLLSRGDIRRLSAEVAAFVAGTAPADQRPFETTSVGTWRR
jgi:hypothetical protein